MRRQLDPSPGAQRQRVASDLQHQWEQVFIRYRVEPNVGIVKVPDDRLDKQPEPDRLLLNHVRVKDGFESVAGALLGHVVVADTLDTAREIFNRNGKVQTVVTRGGDLLSHQGVMIGGSPDKLSGILAKKQEIKSLAAQCDRLDAQAEAAHTLQTEMEVQVRGLERQL